LFFGKYFSGHHGKRITGLELLVLSIVKKNNEGITGYDIIQRINHEFGNMWSASPGTIYPLLNRLFERRLIKVDEVIDKNNRKKKIYFITEKGKMELKQLVKKSLSSNLEVLTRYLKILIDPSITDRHFFERIQIFYPCCFHDISTLKSQIDTSDYSLSNIKKIESLFENLKILRDRTKVELEKIEEEIKKVAKIIENLRTLRKKNSREIPIVDDSDFEKPF